MQNTVWKLSRNQVMPGPRRLLAALLSGILATGCVAPASATDDFPPGDDQMEDLANYQPGFAELTTVDPGAQRAAQVHDTNAPIASDEMGVPA